MTNSQVLLTLWTNLKAKILACQPFLKNKALIIEALEFHRNQASSFTSIHSHEPWLDQQRWKQEKEALTGQLAATPDEQEKENIKKQITRLDQALADHDSIVQAFTRQKEKNELIVKECRELLGKLREREI